MSTRVGVLAVLLLAVAVYFWQESRSGFTYDLVGGVLSLVFIIIIIALCVKLSKTTKVNSKSPNNSSLERRSCNECQAKDTFIEQLHNQLTDKDRNIEELQTTLHFVCYNAETKKEVQDIRIEELENQVKKLSDDNRRLLNKCESIEQRHIVESFSADVKAKSEKTYLRKQHVMIIQENEWLNHQLKNLHHKLDSLNSENFDLKQELEKAVGKLSVNTQCEDAATQTNVPCCEETAFISHSDELVLISKSKVFNSMDDELVVGICNTAEPILQNYAASTKTELSLNGCDDRFLPLDCDNTSMSEIHVITGKLHSRQVSTMVLH